MNNAIILAIAGAAAACAKPAPAVRAVAPGVLEVNVGRGVSLEVLDWGGSGRPLIFLAGGDSSTPHIFDDFAPRFTDNS